MDDKELLKKGSPMGRLAIRLMATTAFCLLAFTSANAAAVAPSIVKTSFSAVGEDSVILSGEINPGERFSEYHFEYGSADCASNPCTSVPVPDASIPSGNKPVPVSAEVTGLSPGTTYHFRLLAKNADAAGGVQGPDKTFTTFPVQPPFGACPNDFLRLENPMKALIEYSSANLPDCRAYEQVSPTDKNGSNATGTVSWVKASPSGDAFSFLTTSGMPGAEGSQVQFPTWVGSKAGGGWSTQGLPVSASTGQVAGIMGWLPDFSAAFEFVRRLGPPEEKALFVRSSADHSLRPIVPFHILNQTLSNDLVYHYVGASADGQTVIFETNEKLTPEAVEGKTKFNLYAWNAATNTVRLASRLPDSECATAPCAPPNGAFSGSYAWMEKTTPALEGDEVTEKGGAVAANYNQDSHVLSADGSRLYFTASRSGQLYVRVNPAEEQSPIGPSGKCEDSELACTLRVSATQKKNGGGGEGADAAGQRPAAFMAASADGKKAFFTSPEKLTDNANTGPEPTAPSIARAALDGTPTTVNLKFLIHGAMGMTVSGGHLYWADSTKGTIGRAKLNGEGAATEVEDEFITGADNPRYVAVEATHVYWTNAGDGEDGTGTIGRAKLGATEGEEVEQGFVTGASNPQGIAVDATHLYWANAGEELPTRTIGRAKLGASAEEVSQDFIQIDTGTQHILPQGIAINATDIYVAENADTGSFSSYIERFNLGDPSKTNFCFDGSVRPGIHGITLDSGHVYFARQGGDSIGRVSISLECAGAEPEFIKDASQPLGLAIDSEHLYWSANQEVLPNQGNDLYRFEPESGGLEDLTPDASDKNGAEVKGVLGTSEDGSYVYFAANGVLAAGASAGNCKGEVFGGNLSFTGQCNLYLYREGQPLLFLTRLNAASDATNWLSFIPTPRTQKTARVSPDGNALLFRSGLRLDSYDNEGTPELYRFRVGDGIKCISCSPTGAPPTRAPGLGNIVLPVLLPNSTSSTPATASVLSRNLSADGNRIFFETTDALAPGDTNGNAGCPEKGTKNFTTPICQDVYEWEAEGTGSCKADVQGGGCFSLLTSGKVPEASFFGDASADGSDAFVFTYAKLAGQDQDQLMDVYDASVDGGLASQNTPPPPKCESTDACQPPPSGGPPFQSPGSESFSGPANPKPKQGCPKGKRKVKSTGKTRCVAKKQKGKGKAHKRTANKTRGAVR
jgi:hypothetical protein